MYCLSRIFCHGPNPINSVRNSCRTLYTLNSLGIDSYIKTRRKVKQYYSSDGVEFREKMKSFVVTGGTSLTFTEVLKRMVHLTNRNEEDLQLLEEMLRKFNIQCKRTRFDNFIFGPVIMRLLHHIKEPDVALKLFKDPDLDGFFDQLMSYHILCDMLYEQGRYQDVIDVYETIRSPQIRFETYPRHVATLVFAACYKENTLESFKYCIKLFKGLNNGGYVLLRRAVAFAAALALKQNAPNIALKIVGAVQQENYEIAQSIKVEAFVRLGRISDALEVLTKMLEAHDKTTKCTIAEDSMDILKEAVKKTDDNELIQYFSTLEQSAIANGHVNAKTLHDLVTSEIDSGRERFKSDNSTSGFGNKLQHQKNNNYEYKETERSARAPRSGVR